MSCLYSELEQSFFKFADRFVFDNSLTYGQLLEEVRSLDTKLEASSILLAELSSGEFFVKTLLRALKDKLIFCPIAKDSGDFIRAESVLKPNAILKEELNLIHNDLNSEITKLCPDGGFIRFTSGTTGAAKGVLISANSALERVKAAEKNFQLSTDDKVLFLMAMPYHFVTSLLMMLKSGVCFTNNPEQASVIYGTPFHYQNLVSVDLPKLRLAVSTSTHLPEIVGREFLAKHSVAIRQSYGIIEVGLPIGDFENSKSESVGKVLEDYQVKFLNGDMNSGTLAIKGPGLLDAYLEPFKLKDEVLKDGWFITGDYASRDLEGNIFIKGRNSSAIHLAGFKIFPEEIEEVLLAYPGITEAQVSSETHDIYGNTVIAKIVCSHAIVEKELRKHCKEKLGIIKTPKRFEIVRSLTKTSTGKLLRKKQDITIVGAGLSGCTVGVLLKKAGYNVTIYDHGKRPDLIVGESLIPALIPVIQRLGLEKEVQGYAVRKPGATIYIDDSIEWNMSFSNFHSEDYAYNVPRKDFDQSFKNLALNVGCEIKNKRVGVEILSTDSFVIDASGRSRFLANTLEIPFEVGQRKDVALFAHFDKSEIKYPGNIHMDVDETGWYWRIPLPGRVSVGVVSPAEILSKYGLNAEAQFDNIIQKVIGKRLVGAKRITQVMKYQNYQLINSRLVGSNWACVGDAAGFADPVFSSGVFLALSGAVNLADSIIANGFSELEEYEKFVKLQLRNWKSIIESFYDQRFFSMIRYGTRINAEKMPEIKSLVAQIMGGYADPRALEMFFSVLDFCQTKELCSNY